MNKIQVSPDLDSLPRVYFGEVKHLKKTLLNLSRCRRKRLFMNNPSYMSKDMLPSKTTHH